MTVFVHQSRKQGVSVWVELELGRGRTLVVEDYGVVVGVRDRKAMGRSHLPAPAALPAPCAAHSPLRCRNRPQLTQGCLKLRPPKGPFAHPKNPFPHPMALPHCPTARGTHSRVLVSAVAATSGPQRPTDPLQLRFRFRCPPRALRQSSSAADKLDTTHAERRRTASSDSGSRRHWLSYSAQTRALRLSGGMRRALASPARTQ